MQFGEIDLFASLNSGCGFINRFGDIFNDLEHLYIIKGGSGTGKSSFMKKAAAAAEAKGLSVEYYHCSSDPESLDGIIIRDTGIGIIDGTAPHTADPKYPGAFDEIINMGDFWDRSILKKNRTKIQIITDQKSRLFREVYRYLGAALTHETTANNLTQNSVNMDKMEKAAKRLCNRLPKLTEGTEQTALAEGITMNGRVKFNTFISKADIRYAIKDRYGIGHICLSLIRKQTVIKNAKRIIGYSPLDPNKLNMIYLPNERILFDYPNEESATETINMDRFICKERYRENRQMIRYALKSRANALAGAYELLSKIKELHFELESIYVSAMDFDKKEEYENKLLTKMLG